MREAKAWVRKNHRTKDLHPSKQRWEVIYEDPHHPTKPYKQRTKGGFPTKAAAEVWADDLRDKTKRGEHLDPANATLTFGALADQWFNSQHFDRERTRFNHQKMFSGNNALMRTFRHVPIGDISPVAVSTFVKEAAEQRAAQTVRHQFYALRFVLDFAVENNMLLVNPARRVSVRRLPRPADMAEHERKRDRLTNADVDRLVTALPEPYDMYVLLLAATGMRPEEACGLTLRDVDTANHAVSVHQVVVEVGGYLTREPNTKTPKSRRTIDLDPYAGEALARYVAEHRERSAQWFAAHPEHEHPGDDLPLFVGTMTGRLYEKSPLERLDYSQQAAAAQRVLQAALA